MRQLISSFQRNSSVIGEIMKKTQMLKNLVAGAFVVAGCGVFGLANAQSVYESGGPAAAATAQPKTEWHAVYPTDMDIRGAYNVGRVPVLNVPGCDGPASFCNMYFGS
jgi:hypothetical protein